MIKLSIIIPVYNLENYIKYCLDSIVPQLNDNVEIIIIDDGSTDKSKEIIKEYTHLNQIRYYYQENKRQGAARNNGILKSKGEYIWFVDGDDLIHENSIETIFKYSNTHLRNHDMMLFGISRLNYAGEIYENKIYENILNSRSEKFIKRIREFSISPCNKIINKDFLIRNDLYFKENMVFEDNEFFLRVYNKAKNISSIKEVLFIRRERVGSTLRSGLNIFKIESKIKILYTIKNIIPEELSLKFLNNQALFYICYIIKDLSSFNNCTQEKYLNIIFKLFSEIEIKYNDKLSIIILKFIYNWNKKKFVRKIINK